MRLLNRALLTLLAAFLVATTLFVGGYQLGGKWCAHRLFRPTDDLDWLRKEFQLNEAQMAKIRMLHEGYLPVCQSYCDQIEAARIELQARMDGSEEASAEVEPLLQRIALLRAQCQGAMLRHFEAVSREMPPEQGSRYLAEMQRLTLGFHDKVEESMSGGGHEGHGGH